MSDSVQDKIKKNKDAFAASFFRICLKAFENILPYTNFKLKNFYNKTDFPWLQILEDNAAVIKEEYLRNTNIHKIISVQDINKRLQDFSYDDGWKVVLLKSYDTIIEKNAALYPNTMKVINQIPNVSNAIFSVLSPKKNIQVHRGMYRGIVFIHLGVFVPPPNNRHTFIVRDEKKHWKEGEAFGFEDSFMHEVVNNSDDYRAILLLEVERKDIPKLLKPVHNWIFNKLKTNANTKLIIENANAS